MKFGIQLYSLKDEIAKRGVDEIFALVKRAGFDCVEFAGFYGLTPAEMKALLDKHGLEGESAHIGIDGVLGSLEYVDEIESIRFISPRCLERGLRTTLKRRQIL